MGVVEPYIEIEKRLEMIMNCPWDGLPHENMIFITKYAVEENGLVQNTTFWFWYPDGLRKFRLGPIQDNNQPENVESNEYPIGLQCYSPLCPIKGVIYLTDVNLRGQKRTYAKTGNYYQPAYYDINHKYNLRTLFQCYSRAKLSNGAHSCQALPIKDGVTALVRDHILSQKEMPVTIQRENEGMLSCPRILQAGKD